MNVAVLLTIAVAFLILGIEDTTQGQSVWALIRGGVVGGSIVMIFWNISERKRGSGRDDESES